MSKNEHIYNDEQRESSELYKGLYLNDLRYNASILNLVNLADRSQQERQAIAQKGNAASIKKRRINSGINAFISWASLYKKAVVLEDELNAREHITLKDQGKYNAAWNRERKAWAKVEAAARVVKAEYGLDLEQLALERWRYMNACFIDLAKKTGYRPGKGL